MNTRWLDRWITFIVALVAAVILSMTAGLLLSGSGRGLVFGVRVLAVVGAVLTLGVAAVRLGALTGQLDRPELADPEAANLASTMLTGCVLLMIASSGPVSDPAIVALLAASGVLTVSGGILAFPSRLRFDGRAA